MVMMTMASGGDCGSALFCCFFFFVTLTSISIDFCIRWLLVNASHTRLTGAHKRYYWSYRSRLCALECHRFYYSPVFDGILQPKRIDHKTICCCCYGVDVKHECDAQVITHEFAIVSPKCWTMAIATRQLGVTAGVSICNNCRALLHVDRLLRVTLINKA